MRKLGLGWISVHGHVYEEKMYTQCFNMQKKIKVCEVMRLFCTPYPLHNKANTTTHPQTKKEVLSHKETKKMDERRFELLTLTMLRLHSAN